MSRLLYASQWFFPENSRRGIQVVTGLREHGHDAEAVTGYPNYPGGRVYPGYHLRPYQRERLHGVEINRLFLVPSHSQSSVGRAANYLSFGLSLLIFLLFRRRKYDLCYVYHPPITVGLAAALSGLLTGKPFILEVQDLWPESVAASRMAGTRPLARILRPICHFVYRRAAMVLGQSEAMAHRLVDLGVASEKVETLFNWADDELVHANGKYDMSPLQFEGRFNFVYGGSFGTVQGLETLVRAAAAASRREPSIQLTLIGDGTEKDRLDGLIDKLGARSVQMVGEIPQEMIGNVFQAADVLAVHLVEDPLFEITIPSKVQFYLATGKPVLAGIGGEAANVIRSAGAGLVAGPGQTDELAELMVRMARMEPAELRAMGVSGRDAYDAKYSQAAAIRKITTCVERVLTADAESAARRP